MKNLNLKRLFVPFVAGILLCACGGNLANSSNANSSTNSGAVNSSVNSAKTGVANNNENNSSCGCNDFGSQEQINKFFGIDSKKEDSQKAKKSK